MTYHVIDPYGGFSQYVIDLYYDKMIGFMVNVTFRARGLNFEAWMISTNLWRPDITPPEIFISSPIDGANFEDKDIPISWIGNDNVAIDHYEVFVMKLAKEKLPTHRYFISIGRRTQC